jgi:aspartate/methionine/tyrosine aminotransferase
MAEPHYYTDLRQRFSRKRSFAVEILERLGFRVYDSGSAFYLWARIPERHRGAMELNEFLIKRAGVAGVPGNAFADSDLYDGYMRFCIAREDEVLRGALTKLEEAMAD